MIFSMVWDHHTYYCRLQPAGNTHAMANNERYAIRFITKKN